MTHDPATCSSRYCTEFACKMYAWRHGGSLGLQVSPSALPNRRNRIAPRTPNNSWEKGIARDGRGMPILNEKGSAMGVKEYAHRRHEVDESRRKAAQKGNTT